MPGILSVGRLLGGSILGGAFTPLSLFAASEPGGWYDPSDLTTLYQDAAGTTPVTAVEQPVGLVLDKSKGLVLGGELVTNGDFATDTWWTKSGTTISGGTGNWSSAASGSWIGRTSPIFTSGLVYSVTWTITSMSAGGLRIHDGSAFGPTRNAAGTYTEIIRASGPNFYIISTGASTTASIDNISARELPGAHLSQSTAAARPVLSARVNLLTHTEDFSNAVWIGTGPSTQTNVEVAPNGTLTADRWTFSAGNWYEQQNHATVSGVAYKFSVWLKSVSGTQTIRLYGSNTEVSSNVTITEVWQEYTHTFTATSTGSSTGVGFARDTSGNAADFYIWGADLRPANAGVGLPAYQRVGAATSGSSTAAGNADYDSGPEWPRYLRFDGTDDFLQSSTISPGSVDKAQVFAGVRKLNDTLSIVVESGAGSPSGSFFVVSGPNASFNAYSTLSTGSAAAASNQTAGLALPLAPDTAVLTAIHDIPAPLSRLRRNGATGTDSTATKGTGNFLAYPLYIGRRGGTSLPFNGHLYSLILRFSAANLDAATITATETWVNGKTRAF